MANSLACEIAAKALIEIAALLLLSSSSVPLKEPPRLEWRLNIVGIEQFGLPVIDKTISTSDLHTR